MLVALRRSPLRSVSRARAGARGRDPAHDRAIADLRRSGGVASAIAAAASAGSGSPWTPSRRARRSSSPARTSPLDARDRAARLIAASPSGTSVAPNEQRGLQLAGLASSAAPRTPRRRRRAATTERDRRDRDDLGQRPTGSRTARCAAPRCRSRRSRPASRTWSRPTRACSKMPSAGRAKYAKNPNAPAERTASPITMRASRSWWCVAARAARTNTISVAGREEHELGQRCSPRARRRRMSTSAGAAPTTAHASIERAPAPAHRRAAAGSDEELDGQQREHDRADRARHDDARR